MALGAAPALPTVASPRRPVTDTYFDTRVTDEYRWLEDASDPAVRTWTDAQNRRTRAALDHVPGRAALERRLTEIFNARFASYSELQFRGGKLFAVRTRPDAQQAYLVTMDSPDDRGSERIVVDPNVIDPTGRTAIESFTPSLDGQRVAVVLATNGSEIGTLHFYDVASGHELGDRIERVSAPTAGGSVEWTGDGAAVFYTRYPRAGERPVADQDFYQQIYRHTLGQPIEQDVYEIGREFPRIAETVLRSSPDGRWLLATVANGDGGEFAHYLRGGSGGWITLSQFRDLATRAEFGPDNALYFISHAEAPRGRVLRLALGTLDAAVLRSPMSVATVVVEQSDGVIQQIVPTETELYVLDLVGGPSQLRVFDHEGHARRTLPLEPISSVRGLLHTQGDEVLYRSESYLTPPAWYRATPTLERPVVTALRDEAPVRYDDCEVSRETATSRDGTSVPVMVIRRRGTVLDGRNPTLLGGYGGYGASQVPSYSLSNRVWLDRGGVVAYALVRGGGEFGEAWHHAGNLTHKQNVFDDFIAAAEHLIEAHYTTPAHLAIRGRSNGGLLMGAAFTQRPDLFRAVVSGVGIYDMLRVELDANGAFNVTEFGTVRDPVQFRALYAYSPYHHVVDGTTYPAVLLTTGEHDGRVNPAQSRKMAARMQAAARPGRPVLLRVSAHAGHGMGSARSEVIAEQTDTWSFLFQQLGMTANRGP